MIKELIDLATHLDRRGLTKEANYLDMVIKRAGVNNIEAAATGLRVALDNLVTDMHETSLQAGVEYDLQRAAATFAEALSQDFGGATNSSGDRGKFILLPALVNAGLVDANLGSSPDRDASKGRQTYPLQDITDPQYPQ